jgi:hypothetical protein
VRLTPRCIDLFRLLAAARWLTTRQIHSRFFHDATIDAARKRLRKLTSGKYLVTVRESRMNEALFTLGRAGKRVLETARVAAGMLERRPPTQREHFLAVNDLRIAAELAGSLSYFFAYWELPGVGWKQPLIPDAIFRIADQTFALEFDRGLEGIQFFVRTKVAAYRRGLEGLPLTAILIVTDREARMQSLARAIGETNGRMLFSTLDAVKAHGLLGPVFHRMPEDAGQSLYKDLLSASLHDKRGLGSQVFESHGVGSPGPYPLKAEGGKLWENHRS